MLDKLIYAGLGALGAGALLLKLYCPWVLYDILYLKSLMKMLRRVKKFVSSDKKLIDIFEQHAASQPDKPFILFEDEVYTYGETNDQANRVAKFALSAGVKCGDAVAMMVSNEPAFMWTFLGFMKIGARPSLINTSVRGKSLLHLIQAAKPTIMVVGKDLLDPLVSISNELASLPVYAFGDNCPAGFLSLDSLLADAPGDPVDPQIRSTVSFQDPVTYIFTSGTTGLPKAALFSHTKLLHGSSVIPMAGMTSSDIIYITLPLYHSSGLCLGVAAAIHLGTTFVLRRKFSASAFWEDCRLYNVTVIQYIGELCRYLVSRPRNISDRKHNVHLAFGNGLRKDIWSEFQDRFNIPNIVEFYGATEGPCSLINLANKVGAVGRNSPLLQKVLPMALVEYTLEDASPKRNDQDRCIPVNAGEKGLLLAPVNAVKFPYYGYLGPKKMSEAKLVRDVLTPGDIYFNTGDVLFLDKEYFLYFTDRLGDTFRWKGENVSTIEVSNVLTETKFITDSNVYGVKVPGHDGRSGMAAIIANDGRPLTEGQCNAIYRLCEEYLAPFARPRFLRIQKIGQMTATFKQMKIELVEEGFNINIIKDPLYFLDQDNKTYVPLNESIYMRLINGGIRV